jgi:uncharacterized protein
LWSVSQDNIELARRGYEAFNRGDIEGFLEFIHPDVELDEGQDLPDRGIYQKHEGFLANMQAWSDVFEELRFEPEELIEVDDRLLVLVRVTGRGRGSGAEFDQRQAHVWTIRDSKGIRLEFYADRNEAEKATGLGGKRESPAR